jgi:hypothetical protein
MRSDDLYSVPVGLPILEDDQAAQHLRGMKVSSTLLVSTTGERVDLSAYPASVTPAQDSPTASGLRVGIKFQELAAVRLSACVFEISLTNFAI